MATYTFKEFQAEYPNDTACLEKLMEMKYGGTHIFCPACGTDAQFHLMNTRKAYACQECGHHIYPCANTIFNKSRTKLTHWFFTMYMLTSTRHGVAAKEIQRQTGVTYKTAWRMCHELRKLMATADFGGMLGGEGKHVEIDETYVGGKTKGKPKTKLENKTIVFGMVERDGKIRTGVVENKKTASLEPAILYNVDPQTVISTDKCKAYFDLSRSYAEHGAVNHDIYEWARGIHHTNTIEGHWSQFKRSIRGTHVSISAKHMWKYACEFSYRRNMRHSHSQMFKCLVEAFSRPRLIES